MQWVSRIVVLALAGSVVSNSPLAEADYYVAQNGQTPGDFLSWSTAASNIQEAVDAASAGDTVWVGAGTYTAPPSPAIYTGTNVVYINNKPLMLRSSNGVPESVIIDGGGAYRGIVFVQGANTAVRMVLDGLTVSNCIAPTFGGGIWFDLGSATTVTGEIRNCVIANNSVYTIASTDRGGGLHLDSSSGAYSWLITNCVIRGNRIGTTAAAANQVGGGISGNSGTLVHSCLIEANEAFHGGGGGFGVGRYENCRFIGNVAHRAVSAGGGSASYGAATFVNCLFANNVGGYIAGAIYTPPSGAGIGSVAMYNCTIASNYTRYGAIKVDLAGRSLTLENCIAYSNYNWNAGYGGNWLNILSMAGATNYISHSLLTTNGIPDTALIIGDNNLTNYVDPLFVDVAGGDFSLLQGSPCINTGSNQTWMAGARDLAGNPRLSPAAGGTVDMGAFEFQIPPLNSGAIFSIR